MTEPVADPVLLPGQARLLLVGLSLATGMEFYTFDSMNLVLPDIMGALGVSSDEASWLLTIYSSTLFLGVPISIWMAGHFGYKRFLLGTILGFALASAGCALAPNFDALLACRALQGFTGAGLVVWWRASIYLLFPKPQRSPSLMRVSTALYCSSVAGLVVSAAIVENFTWRLLFVPCLFYAAGALFLLGAHFPAAPSPHTPRVAGTDALGIGLLAAAVLSLQIVLSRGEIDGWLESPRIRHLAATGASALALFIFWQVSPRNRRPLLSLALLRNRNVTASALLGVCTGMVLSGSLFVLPEFLRGADSVQHSAGQTGRVVCVYALTGAAVRPQMGKVIGLLGQRKTVACSLLLLIFSMLLFFRFLSSSTPDGRFMLPLALFGCCLASLLPSVGSGTVARIGQNELLDGVSIYMTFRQFGASLGVALLEILLEHRETLHSARLFEHLQRAFPRDQMWLASVRQELVARGGYSPFEADRAAIRMLAETAYRQVATLSYADGFLLMAAVGALSICLLPLMPPTPTPAPGTRKT